MDGPFLFRVHSASPGWRLECVANGATVQMEIVNPDELWQSLITTARVLVEACNDRAWQGREVAELAHLLSRIARERAV